MTRVIWLCFFGLLQAADLPSEAARAREAGQTAEAVRLYRDAVKQRPAWAEGWWYLGTLLYDQNSFVDGRDAFARFVKLDPKGAPGWAMLGLCEYEAKDYEHALEHLRKGLSQGLGGNPSLSQVARYHVAILLTHFSQFEAALQIFVQLAAEGVEDPPSMAAAGIAALRMALLPPELPEGRRELVLQVGRAVFDTAARRPAEARRDFEQLLAAHPDEPEIHYLYGGYLLLSDPDAAISEWKKELSVSPQHVPSRLQLAYEYLKRGDPSSALPYAREAAALEPGSFIAHDALGRVLVESGDLPQGIQELETARRLSPQSPENRVALASAYAKAGRSADAARERAEFLRLKKAQQP